MAGELLSVQEAARRMGVNPMTIRRWIKSGGLKAHRAGPKLLRIASADLEAFLSARQEGGNAGEISTSQNMAYRK